MGKGWFGLERFFQCPRVVIYNHTTLHLGVEKINMRVYMRSPKNEVRNYVSLRFGVSTSFFFFFRTGKVYN